MRYVLLLILISLSSCWNFVKNYESPQPPQAPPNLQKVWGNKPVYASLAKAKIISYLPKKQPLIESGNIYAFGHFIFQVDVGRGIHVIDNSIPSHADRIGFIVLNGCSQISMKGSYLYTNCMSDLVTIDMTEPAQLKEVNRVENAFPEFGYRYPLIQPDEKGYYACPQWDSVVVDWVKDSIYASCYKN